MKRIVKIKQLRFDKPNTDCESPYSDHNFFPIYRILTETSIEEENIQLNKNQ